jgi:polyhydroxyalkanoate synthesis regulator phasin
MYEELRRFVLFSSGVAEVTRNQAEKVVKDMVKNGEVRRQQASGLVKELINTSKQSREMLVGFVRGEIKNQVSRLDLANKRDVERLERRVARLEGKSTTAKKSTSKSSASGTKAKKATSRRTPPRKTSPSGATRPGATPPIARGGAGSSDSGDPGPTSS